MNLAPYDRDALVEVINIGVGKAAASLSQIVGTRIELKVPHIRLIDASEIDQQSSEAGGTSVTQTFEGQISGNALLMFPKSSGVKLAQLIGGFDDLETVSELELSGILAEVGNIVLNGVLGSLSNILETQLKYSVPEFYLDRPLADLVQADTGANKQLLFADTQFRVESRDIQGSIVVAFELGALESLLELLAQLIH